MTESKRKARNPCATESEMKTYGNKSVLHLSEAVSIIQGFLPRGQIGSSSYSYLDEYAVYVERLIGGAQRDNFSFPIRPRDLLVLATKYSIPLPKAFADAALATVPRTSRTNLNAEDVAETDELTHPERTGGRPRKGTLVSSGAPINRSRGTRPQGRENDIASYAKQIALEFIHAHGDLPHKTWLDKKLAVKTGRTVSDMARRYALKSLFSSDELQKARRKYRNSKY